MNDCLFCKIANGKMEAITVFETSDFRVVLDKFPAVKGHVLILPKEHFDNIYEMDSETAGKLFALATVVARSMKKVLNCDGLNVLQNNGEAAGQTVNHFHMHLIPRYYNDDVRFSWNTKSFSDEELESLGKALSEKI